MTDNRSTTDDSQVIEELAQSADAPVELTVPPRADRLQIVRAVVERTLFADDWTIDDVADVQLAVDEVCSQIIAASVDGRSLGVGLTIGPAGCIGRITGSIESGIDIDTAGFGWHVVEAVTTAHSISYVETGAYREVTVRFGKFLSAP
ncbi:ATP-binding protein [Gordonia insulae]|uniref:Anti-sigma-F factor RsbW n=1 Tax=Gordonia insulae TaxID=2420509 RepID=A0A3G8JRN3_9ACTN|nr:anti-sigma factor [Gordonia insulae]AZG47588.1 hypothetical protein D7316_04200 [Gordonia insulae]